MVRSEGKTEFFYTDKGLIAIGSPVKLQILDLLREEPMSFDEIVRSTAKAKSTISVHLNDLRSCKLVEEDYDSGDHRRKIYYLTSRYMGAFQEPFKKHYRCMLENAAANGDDRFYFNDTLFHALNFGFEAYGIDTAPVVKIIGNDIGKHLSSIFGSNSPDELLMEIAGFLEFHRNCRVSVFLKDDCALQVEDDFKLKLMPVIGKPVCGFMEGMIEGILKEKLENKCKVRETECYGTGHEHCTFRIKI